MGNIFAKIISSFIVLFPFVFSEWVNGNWSPSWLSLGAFAVQLLTIYQIAAIGEAREQKQVIARLAGFREYMEEKARKEQQEKEINDKKGE